MTSHSDEGERNKAREKKKQSEEAYIACIFGYIYMYVCVVHILAELVLCPGRTCDTGGT